MILVAILIPWLSFFLRGKILQGFLCLILQISLIGWLPAVIWAIISRNNEKNDDKLKKMEERIISSKISNEK